MGMEYYGSMKWALQSSDDDCRGTSGTARDDWRATRNRIVMQKGWGMIMILMIFVPSDDSWIGWFLVEALLGEMVVAADEWAGVRNVALAVLSDALEWDCLIFNLQDFTLLSSCPIRSHGVVLSESREDEEVQQLRCHLFMKIILFWCTSTYASGRAGVG
jgi:hypothetical protein